MQSKYAALQAMAALTVYTMPIVSCVAMGADQYTYMWTGRALPLLALAVPPLILVVYVLQRRSPPQHSLACVLGVVPGTLFFLVGVAIMYLSVRYADRLRTTECAELGGVEDLVAYAKEAVEFHTKCTEGLPVNQTTLLPNCPGYDDLMADNPDREEAWTTLASMERDFFCGGFCHVETRPLWTPSFTKVEPCNIPIANKLASYTRRSALQLAQYSGFLLILFTLWIVFLWDAIKAPGLAAPAAPEMYSPAEGGPRMG